MNFSFLFSDINSLFLYFNNCLVKIIYGKYVKTKQTINKITIKAYDLKSVKQKEANETFFIQYLQR